MRMGVTPGRVRTLINNGRISAHRSAGKWHIDDLPLARTRRPLSPRSREQLATALHTRSLQGLDGQERARAARRLHLLRTSSDPASLLLEWWGGQALEKDRFVRNLLERSLAGDTAGVRDSLRQRHPAYLATLTRLSDRVGTERRIQGLTLKQLAEQAGIPESMLRAIERGTALRSPGPSRKVLKVLGVTPSALPPLDVAR